MAVSDYEARLLSVLTMSRKLGLRSSGDVAQLAALVHFLADALLKQERGEANE